MNQIIILLASLFHYGTLVFFGVFVSAGFLGILKNRKDTLIMVILSLVFITIQGVLFFTFGVTFVQKAYPFITHLPLAVSFVMVYKQTFFNSLLSISVTYFCCHIVRWIELTVTMLNLPASCVELLASALLILLAILLIRYLAKPLSELLESSKRDLIIFSIVPFSYYIYYYATAIYTDLLFQSNILTVEFFPFIVCLAYLLFCTLYFREYKNRIDADHQIQLAKIQLTQYEAMQSRIEETRRARHDLKQHLRLIQAYIDQGQEDALKDYIRTYGQTLPEDTGSHFCKNGVIYTVVRFYAMKAAEADIQFESNLTIPSDITISEPDLCVLLGNLLENALEECFRHNPSDCRIIINGQLRGSRTLILTVDNSPAHEPEMVNGIPVSAKDTGGGIGTTSIRSIAAHYKGTAEFNWKDGTFYASVVLLLNK